MVLLDSNILIDASRPGNAFLEHWISDEDSRVSAISIPEVLGFTGLLPEEEAMFEFWFAQLPILRVDEVILRRAAALRRKRKMSLGDAVIAATALVHGLDLATRNLKDFEHLAELRLINPFEVST